MDNKKIGIIIAIIVLVFILIISLTPKKETTLRPRISDFGAPKIVLTCEEKCNQDIKCLEACYYVDINKAVVAQDINACNKLPNLMRQNCIDKINLRKALILQDKNLCDDIINKETKTLCLNSLK